MKALKALLAFDLVVGTIVAVIAWATIGTEAMAMEFCSLTKAKKCNDIEWSEDYDTKNGHHK